MSLRLHAAASLEVDDAHAFYEAQRHGLGSRFIAALEHAYDQIEAFPRAWPPVRGKARWYILEKFPFGVVYLETPDEIFVLAVSHLSRRRNYWISRLP